MTVMVPRCYVGGLSTRQKMSLSSSMKFSQFPTDAVAAPETIAIVTEWIFVS